MERYRILPGSELKLEHIDPKGREDGERSKKEANEVINELNQRLGTLQELLYAEHEHKILLVLQGMDTSGKDGVIRHVFRGVNPQGVRVASFKVPTPEELDRDYLWRVHKQVPGKGEIVIFNRSHYEDVLVVRVHNLVAEERWSRRYQQINEFERTLSEEGTTILKFFLHIDPEEQRKRLQARLDDSTKHWKFNPGDLKERQRWEEYMQAYEDALNLTSTDWAPWYLVPANRKWFRNLVVASILVKKLASLEMQYPEPKEDLSGIVIT